jgi:hypothetical protein
VHASFIDANYLYATSGVAPVVNRIRLSDFSDGGTLQLSNGASVHSASIDIAAGYAYLGLNGEVSANNALGGGLVKIRLSDFTLSSVLAIPSIQGVYDQVGDFWTSFLDGKGNVYFATKQWPTYLVKVAASTFTEAGRHRLATGEDRFSGSVIDPAGGFAYFASALYQAYPTGPNAIVKVRLSDFERVGTLSTFGLWGDQLRYPQIDTSRGYMYFAETGSSEGVVLQISLSDFSIANRVVFTSGNEIFARITGSAIDTAGGFIYISRYYTPDYRTIYSEVVKASLPNLAVVARLKVTPQGDSVQPILIDPVHDIGWFMSGAPYAPGPIVTVRLSDFTQTGIYSGTEFGGVAATDLAHNLAYLRRGSVVDKVSLPDLSVLGSIDLSADGVVATGTADVEHDRAYFVTNALPYQIVDVQLSTMSRLGARTIDTVMDETLTGATAVMDPIGGAAYFGIDTRIPAQIFQYKVR